MADGDPAHSSGTLTPGSGELMLRIGSALVLAPLAVGTAYSRGWGCALVGG